MQPITDTDGLSAFCRTLRQGGYVTVDTEFMRETTYWPKLCLVQLAGEEAAGIVDPMANGIDLAPLYDLLGDRKTVKVFHAARQDIEIFYHRTRKVPRPLFDTQIAAMVCGFGDAVAYDTLVRKLVKAETDKTSRFTDWSRRPLSDRQLRYALSDVTHLRVIYEKLKKRLEQTRRTGWLDEELAVLTDPETYALRPENAWKRIKTRAGNPRYLGILKEVAAWREIAAQKRDIPRNRILRDEALLEIAGEAPKDVAALLKLRGVSRGFAEGKLAGSLLAAVRKGLALPEDKLPAARNHHPTLPAGAGPLIELLKVLLKQKSEQHHVAQKLIANVADLERIAADDKADVAALHGWRREIFGDDALKLKRGQLALSVEDGRVKVIRLPKRQAREAAD